MTNARTEGRGLGRRRGIAAIAGAAAAGALAAAALAPSLAQDGGAEATRGVSTIDWEAARRDAQAQGLDSPRPERAGRSGLLSFGGGAESSARQLLIPLLLPASLTAASRAGETDAPMALTARVDDYSAEVKDTPRSYLIVGQRVFFETEGAGAPPAEPQAPVDEDAMFVEQLEYGVELSFERYNAVYSITILCSLPRVDPECAREDRVRELAREMAFVE